MTACSSCGAANPADAKFCSNCGSALAATAPGDEVRKTVTILFCDVTGSTQLGEQLDPESLRKVMARFFNAMRAEVELHGGTVEKFIGDAVLAVFGIPTLHEDDALRAVRAADGMRESLEPLNKDLERDFGVRLETRIGVNTGEVLVGPGSTDFGRMTGDAVNTAARLETAAQPGEILIGADTHRLVRDAVDVESVEPRSMKGKAEPVECYRLVGVLAGTAAPPRAFTSPIVGRERELEDLRRAFERSVQDRTCVLFTVLGAAGAGKSRLVEEFLSHVGESAQILVGRCLPYGEGITYWPVAQALRAAMELHDFDEPEQVRSGLDAILAGDDHADAIAARLSEVLGIAEGHSAPEETAWAIRRFLEILASERSVIAVWDDIHWAEPALLDAIDHIADWASDAPILLLCTARPEFLDSRQEWGAGKQRASALTLPPLPADASTQLIANLLGGEGLPADAADRVADAGGGNPLFVEQMVSMLMDDGLVVLDEGGRENGGWTPVGDLSTIAVPPSVAALLAARLERLSDEERRAIGSAAVIGKDFYLGAVRELLPEPDRANAGPLVRALVRKELVREARSTIPGEDAFEFRHILIRDAAYAAIPKERRAEQHRRFADWCVRIAGERIEELEEIVGYHLEQAFRNRESIGALDDEARALATEASARLGSAGMRAYDRPDTAAAINLLRRADALLPPDDPGRSANLTILAHALFDAGRIDDVRDSVAVAEALARTARDPVAIELAAIARWQLVERSVERHEQMRADATRAIAVFEAAGDQRGLVRAWNLITDVEWRLGHGRAQLEAVERALAHARGGTARYEEHEALGNLISALVRGPTPVSDGIARAERTIEAYPGSREVEALVSHGLGHFRARLGEFEAAREAMDRYRSFYRDTGQPLGYLRSAELTFDVAMLAGEEEHACDVVEETSRSLAELGDSWPYLSAFLAQGRYAVGRYPDAREAAAVAVEHGDQIEGSLGLGVLAKVEARSGDAAKALETIAEAVARVDRTDFLFDRGTVHTDRGETLRLLRREDEALSAFDEAIRLFDQKGDLVSSERARVLRSGAEP
jgi:class 3 adenylate cyclase/tetratricopeptide (TPR) repeat protein